MLSSVVELVIILLLGIVLGILLAPRESRTYPRIYAVTGFLIHQVMAITINRFPAERCLMSIKGIAPGTDGVFAETPRPDKVALPAGVIPQWTTSDPDNAPVTSQAADGSGCTVSVPAAANVPSFVLTVSASLPDGTTPSANVTVPINFPEVTGFQIDQVS